MFSQQNSSNALKIVVALNVGLGLSFPQFFDTVLDDATWIKLSYSLSA